MLIGFAFLVLMVFRALIYLRYLSTTIPQGVLAWAWVTVLHGFLIGVVLFGTGWWLGINWLETMLVLLQKGVLWTLGQELESLLTTAMLVPLGVLVVLWFWCVVVEVMVVQKLAPKAKFRVLPRRMQPKEGHWYNYWELAIITNSMVFLMLFLLMLAHQVEHGFHPPPAFKDL